MGPGCCSSPLPALAARNAHRDGSAASPATLRATRRMSSLPFYDEEGGREKRKERSRREGAHRHENMAALSA